MSGGSLPPAPWPGGTFGYIAMCMKSIITLWWPPPYSLGRLVPIPMGDLSLVAFHSCPNQHLSKLSCARTHCITHLLRPVFFSECVFVRSCHCRPLSNVLTGRGMSGSAVVMSLVCLCFDPCPLSPCTGPSFMSHASSRVFSCTLYVAAHATLGRTTAVMSS
jgi:hypothetical protein